MPTNTALRFSTMTIPSCAMSAAASMYVEFAYQDRSTLPLTAPDWTSPITLARPFTFSGLSEDGAPEAGTIGTGELSIEANNGVIGNVFSTDVRIYDVLMGTQTGMTFTPDSTWLHVRVMHKKSGATGYTVRYWGCVDFASIECVMGDVTDPDSWKIKFRVTDTLYQLEQYTMIDFVDPRPDPADAAWSATWPMNMQMSYQATTKRLTLLSNITTPGATFNAGYQPLVNAKWDDGATSLWLGERQSPKVGDGDAAMAPLRYFRVTDIIEAVHAFLGLEASATNNGAAWSDVCRWKWFYASNAPNVGLALTALDIDDLFIVSGFYSWDGSQNVYAHRGTFFDRDGVAPHTLMRSTPLEALRDICISLGLTCRVSINSSNQRYLDVRAADLGDTAIAWDADNYWYSNVSVRPFSRRISGVETVSNLSNTTRGATGNESVKVDCLFSMANFVPGVDGQWCTSYAMGLLGEEAHGFWSALWTLTGTPSGRTYPNAYTVCACAPVMTGAPAGARVGGTAPEIAVATTGGHSYPYGVVVPGSLGGLDFTGPVFGEASSTYSTAVLYPSTAPPVNAWAEGPAMALAHYLFSPRSVGVDAVGVYRAHGMEFTAKRRELIGTSMPRPGTKVTLSLNSTDYECVLTGVREDLLENTTEMTLEHWGF